MGKEIEAFYGLGVSLSLLAEFVGFLVVCPFFAAAAVFLQKKFGWGIDFVAGGNIILAFTDRTNESQ